MNELLEFFRYEYEGEFQQYFFVVKKEEVPTFLNDINNYLTDQCKEQEGHIVFNCLDKFHPEKQINIYFGPQLSLFHFPTYWYINDVPENDMMISKVSVETKSKIEIL